MGVMREWEGCHYPSPVPQGSDRFFAGQAIKKEGLPQGAATGILCGEGEGPAPNKSSPPVNHRSPLYNSPFA